MLLFHGYMVDLSVSCRMQNLTASPYVWQWDITQLLNYTSSASIQIFQTFRRKEIEYPTEQYHFSLAYYGCTVSVGAANALSKRILLHSCLRCCS